MLNIYQTYTVQLAIRYLCCSRLVLCNDCINSSKIRFRFIQIHTRIYYLSIERNVANKICTYIVAALLVCICFVCEYKLIEYRNSLSFNISLVFYLFYSFVLKSKFCIVCSLLFATIKRTKKKNDFNKLALFTT